MAQSLQGLKILDLSMNLPGPYMTWALATLGAEVVKVENPSGGDYARALGGGREGTDAPFFGPINRLKKSVTLNLKHPEGRQLFLDLLDIYDVVVEGFRPGTMDRLGLGFNVLSERCPQLIQVSISGFGQEGSYRLRAGHDINYLALSGILGMTGTRAGDLAIPGVQVADLAGGSLMGLAGLLAAVIEREKTGKGQWVDVAMFDGALSLAVMVFAAAERGLETPAPAAMLLNGRMPCYNVYRTRDDRFMALGAIEFKFWEAFCKAVDRPDLLPHQYGGPETVDEVAAIFRGKTLRDWTDLMKEHDACCEPVLTLDEAVDSPLVRERKMTTTDEKGHRNISCPLRVGSAPPRETLAPTLGADNAQVLGQVGVSEDRLRRLAEAGAI
jgi:crotonobetainyl-CoA:carnitine CoA-transferase CaiB-like acyl-CoA transferase